MSAPTGKETFWGETDAIVDKHVGAAFNARVASGDLTFEPTYFVRKLRVPEPIPNFPKAHPPTDYDIVPHSFVSAIPDEIGSSGKKPGDIKTIDLAFDTVRTTLEEQGETSDASTDARDILNGWKWTLNDALARAKGAVQVTLDQQGATSGASSDAREILVDSQWILNNARTGAKMAVQSVSPIKPLITSEQAASFGGRSAHLMFGHLAADPTAVATSYLALQQYREAPIQPQALGLAPAPKPAVFG